jgi:hypothetical protein
VTGGARSQEVGRRSGCIIKSLQKQRKPSSGCCLESQSRAQSLKARGALLLSFIRKSRSGARAQRSGAEPGEASMC